ncbi:hypothetical protein ALI144C_40100 [Actinosynnema sp. ALI-1.44]|uniref:hypothetical protein n=1 Tax=Actinosynnema sp. ALI-1.44 TaxID=1933779 RepID=UPI00097C4957|nr:hypothetical protein [Actinosynnema sp. ALI-1.44]ONI74978.1 hypothetical protein ALI144C_40100 [Actinosynnema sp. ALI-1.44]
MGIVQSLGADGWRRMVFMYVGPGKRRQWAGRLSSPGRRTPGPVTAVAGFLSILLSLLTFYLIGRITTYGVFWREGHEAGAWGGPTLAGAWLTHAAIAAAAVVVIMWLLVPITSLISRGLR